MKIKGSFLSPCVSFYSKLNMCGGEWSNVYTNKMGEQQFQIWCV